MAKEMWQSVPSWFKLENYDDAENFTLPEWELELSVRLSLRARIKSAVAPIEAFYDFFASKNAHRNVIKHIKKLGLIRKIEEIDGCTLPLYWSYARAVPLSQRLTVCDLDHMMARQFLAETTLQSNSLLKIDGIGLLSIRLNATDALILKEFKGWLKDTRAELENHVNPKITPAVLRRWHNKRILPFWDLTFIAEIENRTIPDHILGDALFPDSEVDVTERVRKRTTEICEAAFSLETIGALRAQGILDSLPPKKIHV